MQIKRSKERGNALVYVLIAIVLFGALSLTLSRQTDTGETAVLTGERAELAASRLISYAAQAKQSIDRMTFEGRFPDEIDFISPSDVNFENGSDISKLFHPDGGGLLEGTLPSEAIDEINTDPPAGWYIGRFNNTEWSASPAPDIMLTAHQINRTVCERINNKVLGQNIPIPSVPGSIPLEDFLIDASEHSASGNIDFLVANCTECENSASLCISNSAGTQFSFYNLLTD